MLRALSRPAVVLMDRYLPDPFIFVLLLTIVAAAAAMLFEGAGPIAVVQMWGDGFWGLLSFSMQMLLILVTGYILASSPPVKKFLALLAGLAGSPGSAIVLVSVVSLIASWVNWGFGLVVGALFARELARQIRVDYRLLIAAAYSGFVIWHGGLAGSIPLTIATPGHFTEAQIGVIGTGETIFASFNLIIVAILFVVIPLVNWLMVPREDESVYVTAEQLGNDEREAFVPTRPAEHLENSRLLMWVVGLAGLVFLAHYFFVRGAGLNLNIVNFLFLMLGIVLHGTARNLLDALQEAVKGGAGIVIQFPFYAGIMAIMTQWPGAGRACRSGSSRSPPPPPCPSGPSSAPASSTCSCPRAAASGRCRHRSCCRRPRRSARISPALPWRSPGAMPGPTCCSRSGRCPCSASPG